MRILIATGGSPHSQIALRFGADLARYSRTPTTILTVIRRDEHRPRAKAILARAARLVPGEIPAVLKIRVGHPAEEILREAEAGDYHLILVGDRQRHPFMTRFLLGSVAERMTNTDVVKALARCQTPVSDNTVGRIYHRLGDDELAGCEPGRVVVISIDEYSLKKRHTYATVITNPVKHTIIETFRGRDHQTVQAHLTALFPAGQIKLAVINMSRPFRSALLAAFPTIKLIIDKFHVMAVVIDALDESRKRLQRTKPAGHKPTSSIAAACCVKANRP